MSSLKLRLDRIGGGRGTRNNGSVSLEKLVQSTQETIMDELHRAYPPLAFSHTTRMQKSTIHRKLRLRSPEFGDYQSNSKSHIRPDGGFYWAHLPDGTVELILVMEAKKQGTNDLLIAAGLKPQAMGNAIERACKNFLEIDNFMWDKNYFPYLIMANGHDLREGSSIRDRLTACMRGSQPNQYYVPKLYGMARATVFMQENPWSWEEIVKHGLEVAKQSIEMLLWTKGITNGLHHATPRRRRVSK